MTHFVFITGGVISSLGKGLAAASLGAVLRARGLRVCLRKVDPYLNVDPGTMSPYQHGEVFVMDDGTEADLDCGHYERFTDQDTTHKDTTTTGQIYQSVLDAERRGDYLGRTVQVVPHVTDRIKAFLRADTEDVDVLIAEIGGTVGDIEGLPFLEALRQLRLEEGCKMCVVHVGWVPYVKTAGEFKTKPLQHSVKDLQHAGLQPDLLLLRCDQPLPDEVLAKVGLFCNVPQKRVVCGMTQDDLYEVPLAYHAAGLDQGVLDCLEIKAPEAKLSVWQNYQTRRKAATDEVTVGVVGKYGSFPDAYRSLYEALAHAGVAEGVRVTLRWIDPEVEKAENTSEPTPDAILVPGGFGTRGLEGTLAWIKRAREEKVPYFGICLGMQLAVIEAARAQAGFEASNSAEFNPETPHPVIHQLRAWEKEGAAQTYEGGSRGYGGTMRLGAYPCRLKAGSLARQVYGSETISERHRHRFEVNEAYIPLIEGAGLHVVGRSPCGKLCEVVERDDHPFFIGVQFHPELLSRPHRPHALFRGFARAAQVYAREREPAKKLKEVVGGS